MIYAVWIGEISTYLRLKDLTGSKIPPPLDSATLTWMEKEAAEKSLEHLADLCPYDDLKVQELDNG